MTTINVSGQITNEDLLLCDSTKLLMNCRDFTFCLSGFAMESLNPIRNMMNF